LVFRSWGNGKTWTGITSIVILALMALFLEWWLALITIACGIFILIVFRDDRNKKLFSLMILSSLLFALFHAPNYSGEDNGFLLFVSVLEKFGFGLVASYLVINYNLLWSMALHVLNNSIVAIPMFIGLNAINNGVEILENEDFRLEMRTVLVEDKQLETSNQFYADSANNTYFGNVAAFANQAMYYDLYSQGSDPNHDTVTLADEDYSGFPKCHFNLTFKKEPFNYHRLLSSLEKEGWIEIDTTLRQDSVNESTERKVTVIAIKNKYDPWGEYE